VARAARGERGKFGPALLSAHLAQLLPQFPHLALCVAFSGGVDSTALLAALARLHKPALRLRALHVDHQLRPDSQLWSAHCRRTARALGVRIQVCRIGVPRARGGSLEAAARRARYAALAAALRGGEVLLTAHHEDDQLETVLLQLLRGAGVAGLAAMPAVAPFAGTVLVRPLLSVAHQELLDWVSSQGLSWVEDDSNAQEQLDRNYLRHNVLPRLRARWPAAAATVARSARHAAEAQRLLDQLAEHDAAQAAVGAALSAKVLRRLSPERRRNALRYWIAAAGLLAPSSRQLEQLCGPLLDARRDAQPSLAWQGARMRREVDLLHLQAHARSPRAGKRAPHDAPLTWRWALRRPLRLPGGRGALRLEPAARGPLSLAALPPVLTVRQRRGGERLRPVPGGPRRTLKGLLQEARVPLEERARLPLIFAGETLLAVGERWLDATVQAHAGSTRRGRLVWRTAG
jgi:tRNA(Ile)-lysidine synthase